MLDKRYCLYCDKELKGRSDKKHCDDQCRASYHSMTNAIHLKVMGTINRVLKKNRRILAELDIKENTKILRKDLLKMGFDFGYFTSIQENSHKNRCYFCYEMGYLSINPEWVLLIRKESLKQYPGHIFC